MRPLGTHGNAKRLAPRKDRTRVLEGLARLLAAGIAPAQALKMLAAEPDGSRRRLARAAQLVGKGVGAPAALFSAGCVTASERALLDAFAAVGRLDLGLDNVARDLEREAALAATVTARLAFPGAVLVIGALTAPLPGLIRGDLSGMGYLLRATVPVVPIAALIALAMRLSRDIPAGALAAFRRRQGLPPVKRTRRVVYAVLGRSLGAGLDAAAALEASAAALPDAWADALANAASRAARGSSIAAALHAPDVAITPAREYAVFASAEAAGALPEALARQVRAIDEQLERRARALAAWVPRAVYALVVGWVLAALL